MYNHAPEGYVCPFCRLVEGTAHPELLSTPEDVLHRDAMVTAFVGSHQWPNNPGNIILVPNAHYENIYELPLRYAAPLHRLARAVALAMKAVYGCDGVSTRQHNEPAGNQDVWHYHLHVTPRYHGDAFYACYTGQRALMPPQERAEHARRIREHLEV